MNYDPDPEDPHAYAVREASSALINKLRLHISVVAFLIAERRMVEAQDELNSLRTRDTTGFYTNAVKIMQWRIDHEGIAFGGWGGNLE